jgi:hypothetical protein
MVFLDGAHLASRYPSVAESHSGLASLSHMSTVKGTIHDTGGFIRVMVEEAETKIGLSIRIF